MNRRLLLATDERSNTGSALDAGICLAQNAYWACPVWWLLRVFGFDDASVLNGGWQKWRREGRPTEIALVNLKHTLASLSAHVQS
jgi:3-mercaptopyruvate sulfurtransferase SseA